MSEKIHVLIVDDEAVVRTTLRLASKSHQWQVEAVESAEEALKVIRQKRFDVALVDKNLPEMSGVDLIREIRKTDNKMGILMITGFASVDSALETLHLGIDSYVEKPFDNVYDVIEKVEKVALARRSKRQTEEHNAINMHFAKAMAAFQRSKESNEQAKQALLKGREANELIKVLIASPVPADREWMANQFGASTRIITAASVEETLAIARKAAPELLIIDISAQDSGVVATLKKVRSFVPRSGLIVVTEKRPPLSIVTHCIELGVRVIPEKPLNDSTAFRGKLETVARRVTPSGEQIQWSKGKA
jgi:DNA-binding NtrC family response regulator